MTVTGEGAGQGGSCAKDGKGSVKDPSQQHLGLIPVDQCLLRFVEFSIFSIFIGQAVEVTKDQLFLLRPWPVKLSTDAGGDLMTRP